MKKVLITGSNGLLGQKLTNLLVKRDACQVVAVSKGANRNPEHQRCEYHQLDITDFDALKEFIYRHKPAAIINTAAMTNVDACEQDPQASYQINVQAVRSLCGLSLETGAKLLHLSTDFIFDGKAGPYKEEDAPNPLSVYGRHKLEAEQMIRDSGAPGAIIRTVLLYGVAPQMPRSNIVLWVRDSLMEGKPIRIVNDQYRTPTLAEDLADGVASILFRDKEGVFHISGAEVLSILEIAHRTAEYWKLDKSLISPISSSELNQAAPRPPRTGFVILKAQTTLNFKPTPFEKGLELVDRQIKIYS